MSRDPQHVASNTLARLCEAQALRLLSRFDEATAALAVPMPGLDPDVPEHLRLMFLVCTQRTRSLAGAQRMSEVGEELRRCEDLAGKLPRDLRGGALSETRRLAAALDG